MLDEDVRGGGAGRGGRKAAARWEKLRHEQFANIIRTGVRRRLAADGGTILSNYTTLPRRCRLPEGEITLSRNCARSRDHEKKPDATNANSLECISRPRQKQLSKGGRGEITRTKDSVRKGREERRKLEEKRSPKREETAVCLSRDTGSVQKFSQT